MLNRIHITALQSPLHYRRVVVQSLELVYTQEQGSPFEGVL